MTHTCSDCGRDLDTYNVNTQTIGTCRNLDCRLYGVTLDVLELDALTECQRVAWGEQSKRFAQMEREEVARSEELLARIPEHLRRIG